MIAQLRLRPEGVGRKNKMSLKNLNTDNLQIFNKALAPDNVPEELLKYGADVIAPVLCEMLQM